MNNDLKEILPRVQGPIRQLLDQELSCGNSIVEIAGGWPMKRANVWLAKWFQQDYRSLFPELAYAYLGDPKSWIEHYQDVERGLMVAVSASAGVKRG